MPEFDESPAAERVEERDGLLYLDDVQISEEAARAQGWTPPEAPPAPPADDEAPVEATEGAESPESVMSRLRAAYAAGEDERETTLPIAPGRYRDLAAIYRPMSWELRRKTQRRFQKIGNTGTEGDLQLQSILAADACKEIVMRPQGGGEYVGLHTLIGKFGDEPIRYDARLAEVLGMDLVGGETQADIMRLVFNDPGAFEVHVVALTTWSAQIVGDEDEEDEEGGDRPT